jgi:polar amino acid transport system permease protein
VVRLVSYQFNWSVIARYAPLFWQGTVVTIELSVVSILLATLLGTAAGLGRLSPRRLARGLSGAYVEFFMNTPLVVQLFFWYFGLPMVLPEAVKTWLWAHNFEFVAGVLGLTVYTATFIAETVRAGVQAVDRGQWEAALAHGLSHRQTLAHVILPQAFRIILPPLGNQFLNLTKNSSLAMTIAVQELTFQSQAVEAQTFRGFEATTVATLIYLALTLALSVLIHLMEGTTMGRVGTDRGAERKVEATLTAEGGLAS